ncbi:MAG: glycerol kinase GlpK [Caldilineaceae bacterium]|nr:glycerol kinase GlpK [Caldilineaceae bacterium]
MRRPCILALDQGTTNSKAVLVDQAGEIVATASRAVAVNYPQPGWVEQDALALWSTLREAVDDCLSQPDVDVVGVGVSNQRETVLMWDRTTGEPLGPAVIWQCRRSAPFCHDLAQRGLEPWLRRRTGLTIDPLFSASKMRWLLDNVPGARTKAEAGDVCLGTVDSWVLWNLTGGAVHRCDFSNASRTQLFNLETLRWDDELLALFGIPAAALPELGPSSQIFGRTAAIGALPADIPVGALIGDSHAALFGHAGFEPGTVKATYGTGTSLMTPIPAPVFSERGLSTTIAWARQDVTYALEGNISVTGAAVQWTAQLLGLENAEAVAALARQVENSGGVYLVPAFVGLGAPHWHEAARGTVTGLTRGSGPAQLARATIESIAYQVRDVFDVMDAEAGVPLQRLLADGGASRNDMLMQFQADMIGRPVVRRISHDVAAQGAAYLAGLAVGFWASEAEIAALPRPSSRFDPQMNDAERSEFYAGWQRSIAQAVHGT